MAMGSEGASQPASACHEPSSAGRPARRARGEAEARQQRARASSTALGPFIGDPAAGTRAALRLATLRQLEREIMHDGSV
jgi:hypothetical protein